MKLRLARPIALAVLGLAFAMPQAKATLLFPGDSGTPSQIADMTDFTLLTSTSTNFIGSNPAYTAKVTLYVWKDTGATFTNKYAFGWLIETTTVANPPSSSRGINNIALGDFSKLLGYGQADFVYYSGAATAKAPGYNPANISTFIPDASWSDDASSLTYSYGAANVIQQGKTSVLLIMRSKATGYQIGTGQADIQFNNGFASNTNIAVTITSVPEPGTLVLAGLGLPLLGLYGLRRRSRA